MSEKVLGGNSVEFIKEKTSEYADSLVLRNAGAPTSATVGTVGQLLEDTANGKLYQCTAASGGTYSWTEVGSNDDPSSHNDWGTIEYYTDTTDAYEAQGFNVTASVQNAQTYKNFLETSGVDYPRMVQFMYEEVDGTYCWRTFGTEGEIDIPANEMLATTGISAVIDDPEEPLVDLTVDWTTTVNTSGPTTTLQLVSEEDYNKLSDDSSTTDPDYGPFGPSHINLYGKQIKKYTFPNWWVGYIPDRFLQSCVNLTAIDSLYTIKVYMDDDPRPIIPVEKIGDNFLAWCSSFNSQLLFGPKDYDPASDDSSMFINLEIGGDFLRGCRALNTIVGVLARDRDTGRPDTIKVGGGFMYECSSYVQKSLNPGLYVDLFSYIMQNADTIPNGFMYGTAVTFIMSTSWTVYATEIGNDFFGGIAATSVDVALGRTKKAGSLFPSCPNLTTLTVRMANVESLDSLGSGSANLTSITLTPFPVKLTNVGAVCSGCRSLTSFKCGEQDGIILPNVLTAGGVLNNCSSFNQAVRMPKVATVGGGFLSGATSFNQDLQFDCIYGLTGSQYSGFMENCKAFNKSVDFGDTDANALYSSYASHILSTNDSTAAMYTTGITIKGKHAADFLTTYPNRDSSPYRKLINGGAGSMIINDATLTIQNNGTTVDTFTANSAINKTIDVQAPSITMTTTDPGEGSTLAANNFIAVYDAS